MKRPLFFTLILATLLLFLGCQQAPQGAVRVAAAANLSAVAPGLTLKIQELYPKVQVEWTFGSSGALLTQLENGAPFDLLLSADVGFAQKAWEKGLTLAPPQVYARGILILLSTRGFDISAGLASVAGAPQFVIANPDTAPYGKAAKEALEALGLWEEVQGRLVFGQSIGQAKQLVLGATGLGLIHRSALKDEDMQNYQTQGVHWISVPAGLHAPLDQALVVSRRASEQARVLGEFFLSQAARQIFVEAGYGVP